MWIGSQTGVGLVNIPDKWGLDKWGFNVLYCAIGHISNKSSFMYNIH